MAMASSIMNAEASFHKSFRPVAKNTSLSSIAVPIYFLEGKYIPGSNGSCDSQKSVNGKSQDGSSVGNSSGNGDSKSRSFANEIPKPSRIIFEPSLLQVHQEPRGPACGLQNLGNTCFLNSILQALCSLPPLTNYFRSRHHSSECSPTSTCYMCMLESTIRRMMLRKKHSYDAIAPKDIVKHLRCIHRGFRTHAQCDAHEFFIKLLEKAEESILSPFSELKLDFASRSTTVLHQIFGRQMASELKCPGCGYVSRTFSIEMTTPIDIPQSKGNLAASATLESALSSHVAPERLERGNEWRCGGCRKMVCAIKRVAFATAPLVLTIQIKRFKMASHGNSVKVSRPLKYPESLDISPYMHPQAAQVARNHYKLQSIVIHAGSASFGHYYAYAKAPNEAWYCMDDSSVQTASIKRVLSEDAYLLFYTREPDSTEISRQGLNGEISNLNALKISELLVSKQGSRLDCRDQQEAKLGVDFLVDGESNNSRKNLNGEASTLHSQNKLSFSSLPHLESSRNNLSRSEIEDDESDDEDDMMGNGHTSKTAHLAKRISHNCINGEENNESGLRSDSTVRMSKSQLKMLKKREHRNSSFAERLAQSSNSRSNPENSGPEIEMLSMDAQTLDEEEKKKTGLWEKYSFCDTKSDLLKRYNHEYLASESQVGVKRRYAKGHDAILDKGKQKRKKLNAKHRDSKLWGSGGLGSKFQKAFENRRRYK